MRTKAEILQKINSRDSEAFKVGEIRFDTALGNATAIPVYVDASGLYAVRQMLIDAYTEVGWKVEYQAPRDQYESSAKFILS